jgi:acyl-CoA synthetase (AMP-forming)/AMP-acid ligase II
VVIIAELVRRSCSEHGPKPAIIQGSVKRTYAQLWDRSVRLANLLRDLGIRPGDRVATLAPNSVTTLEEMTGLAVGGYVRTALHPMNTGSAHRYMLENAAARVLIVDPELSVRYADDIAAAGLDHVIVHGDGPGGYEQLLAASSAEDHLDPVGPDDVLHLAYSSGSSGRPKASVHTHGSWMHVTTDHATMLPRLTANDVYLAAAPLTHAASTVLYALLARGSRIVAMNPFDPATALELIEQERVTLTVMVPTMIQALVEHPDVARRDLGSLRALLYAGAPISVRTARTAQQVFGDVLFQTYGQSECLPGTCLTPEDHAAAARDGAEAADEALLTSAGRPCLNTSIAIVDIDGRPVAPFERGEILLRTDGRMRHVHGDPETTAARITDDGFVRTRDIGYLDDRGYLFVVDRKDDMIVSGGFNIWPAEVEKALAAHPAVAEAAVVGVAHPRWGETPHAVVVLRSGATATAEELIAFCREQIGGMKKPTSLVLRTEPLPRNGVGKLQRRTVADEYWPAAADERRVHGA